MAKQYTITTAQIELMKHAIGFESRLVKGRIHRRYSVYRIHFTTPKPNSAWEALCEQGLAEVSDFPHGHGDDPKIYRVSSVGLQVLAEILDIHLEPQ